MSTQTGKRIAVLLSVGRHPVGGVARYSRNDALALESARRLAADHGALVDVIHAGDPGNPALADYLVLGATRLEVLAIETGADVLPALLARLAGYDLIVCGTRSEGGPDSEASGMLPYLLAAGLGMCFVGAVLEIAMTDAELMLRQFLPKGRRRKVALSGPAVIAIHPHAGTTPSYAYARLSSGVITAVAAQGAPRDSAWHCMPVTAGPKRLAAAEKRSGHARMLAATVAQSRGGQVLNAGDAQQQARAILSYLREHKLIDY